MTTNTKFDCVGRRCVYTYRTTKEFDGQVAAVFIPHTGELSAYIYHDRAYLIDRTHAYSERRPNLTYLLWTETQLVDAYEDDTPKNILVIARRCGKVLECNGEWVEPGAIDEYDWALGCLGDGMRFSQTFDTLDDAVKFIVEDAGEAAEVLAEALEKGGFIARVEDEDGG